MTAKELHKLKRQDVLQLLLAQSEELEEVKSKLEVTETDLNQLSETYERLRRKLDQKDAQIHRLREIIEEERNQRKIQLEEAGSLAEAALKLNGVFEAAQKAADQYLYNIRLSAEERMAPDEAIEESAAEEMV